MTVRFLAFGELFWHSGFLYVPSAIQLSYKDQKTFTDTKYGKGQGMQNDPSKLNNNRKRG